MHARAISAGIGDALRRPALPGTEQSLRRGLPASRCDPWVASTSRTPAVLQLR